MTRACLAGACLAALAFALPGAARAAVTERGMIDAFVSVPPSVMATVGTVFPESSAIGTSFLSDSYDPNVVVSEPANLTVTFLHEGAGYRNTLGYFTYVIDGASARIVDRQLVFPNASFADPSKGWGGGTLTTGDTVTLRDAQGAIRTFQPGERVGFFVVADGWRGSAVRGWNEASPGLPSESAAQNATDRVFSTLDALNPESFAGFPERTRHVAMLRIGGFPDLFAGDDFLLLGFEDLRRDGGSDEDFNDVVVVVHANPIEAVRDTEVPYYAPENPDPDGDGVSGLADYFPNDPSRAFIIRTPATGWQTIAFEDRYPLVGDADFNDAVIQMAQEIVLDANGEVKDICGTYHLFARGAASDHSFGLVIPGVAAGNRGIVELESFSSTTTSSTVVTADLADFLEADVQGEGTLVLREIIADTKAALSPDDGTYTNTTGTELQTPPASARFLVTFDQPLPRAPLGAAPFDPFLGVWVGQERVDIHLPGKPGLVGRPTDLPTELGPDSFLDDAGYPFALLMSTAWQFPLERVNIEDAYPSFRPWRESWGASSRDWYAWPSLNPSDPRVSNTQAETIRSRPWILKASAAGAP